MTFSIYNAIRWAFLYRKFRMQPFTMRSIYTLVIGGAAWWITQALFAGERGILGIVVRSAVFLGLYGAGVLGLRLSEDINPYLEYSHEKAWPAQRRSPLIFVPLRT